MKFKVLIFAFTLIVFSINLYADEYKFDYAVIDNEKVTTVSASNITAHLVSESKATVTYKNETVTLTSKDGYEYKGFGKKLKEHAMKLAVCSNKPHPAAVKVIAQLFDGEFDMVVGQSEAIRRKPAPDGPLMVAEKFGVKPEECMYVGDTSTDMKTGKAAGMYTVGALWGFRDRKELNENGADLVAEKPTDLVKICEEHGND